MSMMIFIFLCFSGLFIMFFFLLRSQEKMHESLREEIGKTRAQLRLMEGRLAVLLGEEDQSHGSSSRNTTGSSSLGMDPLDSLSMGDEREKEPSGGLDLHFDPSEHLRR